MSTPPLARVGSFAPAVKGPSDKAPRGITLTLGTFDQWWSEAEN